MLTQMDVFPSIETLTYAQARAQIKSGDILLASGDYMFSRLIQKASQSCWSHVAFVIRLDDIDRVMVLESVEGKGVRTIPLSEYVEDFEGSGRGYRGRLAIARHQRFNALCTEEGMKNMAQFAIDRFAYPYDEEEIARITARLVASAIGFNHGEIRRDREYICSEYVYECYQRLGIAIQYDARGFVAPADFARNHQIDLLWELQVHDNP